MRATEFLQLLWGERPPGYIELWTKSSKKSNYLKSPLGANIIATEGAPDVYTGTCLAFRQFDARQRAKATQRIAIAGLWLDVDVNGGPDNKRGSAPCKQDAERLARQLHEPTLIVDSGYGVHAWWLLTEPWRFNDLAEQQQAAVASAQWYALHRRAAQRHGWTIDHTHDLARLLRVPGTTNAKGDPARPVDVIDTGGPRYDRSALLDLAAHAGGVDLPAASRPGQQQDAVVARTGATPPMHKVEALAFNSPEFQAALDHEGHPGWSQSEWDLSLASQAAAAGWTGQEIADLVVWDRVRHGKPEKARRAQYVRRTVAIATERADRAGAGESLQRLARTPA